MKKKWDFGVRTPNAAPPVATKIISIPFLPQIVSKIREFSMSTPFSIVPGEPDVKI